MSILNVQIAKFFIFFYWVSTPDCSIDMDHLPFSSGFYFLKIQILPKDVDIRSAIENDKVYEHWRYCCVAVSVSVVSEMTSLPTAPVVAFSYPSLTLNHLHQTEPDRNTIQCYDFTDCPFSCISSLQILCRTFWIREKIFSSRCTWRVNYFGASSLSYFALCFLLSGKNDSVTGVSG